MTLTGATSVDEGSTATYTVTLGAAATTALTIPYTLSGTATSGTDYTTTSTGTISVAAGAKTGTLTLTTVADTTTENAETVIVTLGTVSGFTAVSGQGAVTTTINDTSTTPPVVPGETFSLTAGADIITTTNAVMNDGATVLTYKPGNNDDNFRGVSNGTLSSNDIINAGGGTDTLQFGVTADTAGTIVRAPSLTSVEAIKATLTGAANSTDATFSGANSTGITEVWSLNSVGTTSGTLNHNSTLIFNNLTKAVKAGVQGGSIGHATADTYASLTVSYTDVTGSDDSSTLLMNLGKANVVTVAGVENLTIDATGKKTTTEVGNYIKTLTAAAAKTLVIKGDGDLQVVDVNTNSTNLRTINAAQSTGNVTIDAAIAADMSVTGGQGNDKFLFAATLNTSDVIDGGTGNNTLSANITQLAAFTTTAANIKNIKTVEVADAAGTTGLNLALFGADSVNFGSTVGAATYSGLKSGSTVGFAGTPTAVVLSVTGADTAQSDELNISISADATATYAFTAANIEKLNVSLAASVTNARTATLTPTDAQLKEVVITATNANVTYNADSAANTVLSKVDAAGLTNGILTFTGSTAAVNGLTVTGSKNNDVIVGSSQGDNIVSGAGNDNVTPSGGNDTVDISGGGTDTIILAASGAANGKDTITGFTVGSSAEADKLNTDAFIGTIPGSLTTIANLISAATLTNDSINIVNFNAPIATKDFANANFSDLFGAGKVFSASATTVKAVIVVQGTDQTQVLYANESVVDDASNTFVVGDIHVVGVLNNVTNANTFVIGNFPADA